MSPPFSKLKSAEEEAFYQSGNVNSQKPPMSLNSSFLRPESSFDINQLGSDFRLREPSPLQWKTRRLKESKKPSK